jgi:antitoxin component YwqK of YwqJK toxin-antitoxin module
MQRLIVIFSLILTGVLGESMAQEVSTPAWLPAAKKDTTSITKKKHSGINSLISGLDPVATGSLPGGNQKSASISTLFGETIPDLGLRVKEYKSQKGERDRKKKLAKLAKVEYKGVPMQKMESKMGSGDRATIEYFHVLHAYEPISEYVRPTEIRWYDKKTRRLSSSIIKKKELALPLHGPYKKYIGENLIEEGFYDHGVKDGRWVKYDTKYVLLDKATWNKGFPAESQITYYDSAHTKIKEVIPIVYQQKSGEYLKFFPEGQLMENGKYADNHKVGRWVEYYQFRRLRKKETQYPKNSWEDDFDPFVLREWDDKGKLLYDYTKDPRASAEEDTLELEEKAPLKKK